MRTLPGICLALIFCAASAKGEDAPNDPTAKKLEAARAAFAKDSAKVLRDAKAALVKAEAAARRKGDKESVDKLKADRKALDDSPQELPISVPSLHRKRLAIAQGKMEAAFREAVRDYTKTGDDKRSDAVKIDHAKFQGQQISASELVEGRAYRNVNCKSGLAVAMRNPQHPANSKLMQTAPADDANQCWTIKAGPHQGGVAHAIRNNACSLTLAIDKGGRNSGDELVVWTDTPGARWKLIPYLSGFKLQSIYSDLMMGVADDSKEAGARVIQCEDLGGPGRTTKRGA